MARSMTAYGRAVGTVSGKSVTVEIKSVNNRFLDTQIKISRGFSFLEENLKACLRDNISRGKVDIYLGIDIIESTGSTVVLDKAYAESYIKALTELRDTFGLQDDITVMSVAQNRDLFIPFKPEEDTDKLWSEILPFVNEALASFNAMRENEGENLKKDLLAKEEYIKSLVDKIALKSDECTKAYHDKFIGKIKKILDDNSIVIDEQRVLTECAIYTDKITIDEEIVRLKSHFKSFENIFKDSAPIGRKLDFLLQEMNRETNTIGSKCSDAEIARIVVDIKTELEKIREQIQNLE